MKLYPGALTDVRGLRVGHADDPVGLTGCTVVLCDAPYTVGGEVRGRAPGTRETALLAPGGLVTQAHAVLLTGGSAFGLAAADGVMRYLEERGVGYDAGVARVPIVPAAVLFDLGVGSAAARPDSAMGYAACVKASATAVAQGNVGAGLGASVGKLAGPGRAMKGGLGMASLRAGDLVVAALAAVNALGEVRDPESGIILAGVRGARAPDFTPTSALLWDRDEEPAFGNTIIGVVACNAVLDQAEANHLAQSAQDGLARVVRPVHTLYDGDTIFALATGEARVNAVLLTALAVEAMARAIANAVNACRGVPGLPSGTEWRNCA
jgi:L-aminopeptidase/D-esterase-like protein